MGTCKTCGRNCEGEYCFHHKPRKPLASNKGFKVKVPEKHPITQMNPMKDMFLEIWKKRQHLSEVSGLPLIGEPLSSYFHHILPKSKYPEAWLDEENIILLTLEEHSNVENDMYRYEEVNKRREQLKQKYDIA
jgi:hypothetical protein